MNTRALALLSGGLDSSVALLMARETREIVTALTFDYGQRAARREIDAAAALCDHLAIEHAVIELPWLAEITGTSLVDTRCEVPDVTYDELDEHSLATMRARQVWVPNRNGVLINIAACFADAHTIEGIIVGFNAEEGAAFVDNTQDCADAITRALSFTTLNAPRVISPTIAMRKREIADHAARFGLTSFWSCYRGGGKMCGTCESCARTIRAFREAGHLDNVMNLFKGDVR